MNKKRIFIPSLINGFILLTSFCYCQEFKTELEICEHSNDADATVIQVTDQYFPSDWEVFQNDSRQYSSTWAEFLALKYNIPLHVFESEIKGSEFNDFLQMGRGGTSVYYPSCLIKYKDSIMNKIRDQLSFAYGKKPTTVSYGCGKTNYSDSLPKFILSGRNSSYINWTTGTDDVSWYGKDSGHSSHLDFSNTGNLVSRPSNGRFYSDILENGASIEDASENVVKQVKKVVNNRGFYINFMHWHDFYRKKDTGQIVEGVPLMGYLFESMSEGIQNSNVAKLDYNEAIEYLYAKEALVSAFLKVVKNKIEIVVKTRTPREKDYSVISTPITFKVNKDSIGNIDFKSFSTCERITAIKQDSEFIYLNIILDFSGSEEKIQLRRKSEKTKIPNLWSQVSLKFKKSKK